MHALFMQLEKRLKGPLTTMRMEADNHVETSAMCTQHPKRPMLFSPEDVGGSQPMTILKSSKRICFDMPMHHANAAAGYHHCVAKVRGYRSVERIVKRLGQASRSVWR